MEEEIIYIVPSIHEKQTFFLFRDNLEIKFKLVEGKVAVEYPGKLLPRELIYIQRNYL